MPNVTEIELSVTCKPFTALGRGEYRVLVTLSADPEVRVWNHLEHNFTLCHSLSSASQRSIVARARKAGVAS